MGRFEVRETDSAVKRKRDTENVQEKDKPVKSVKKEKKAKSPWTPFTLPTLAFTPSDLTSSILSIHEISHVDITTTTSASGAKVIRFGREGRGGREDVRMFGGEDEDEEQGGLDGFMHVDDFKDEGESGDEGGEGNAVEAMRAEMLGSDNDEQDGQEVDDAQEDEDHDEQEEVKPVTLPKAKKVLSDEAKRAKKVKAALKKQTAILKKKTAKSEEALAQDLIQQTTTFTTPDSALSATTVAPIVTATDTTAWEKYDIHPDLMRAIADLGFTAPTQIQDRVLPIALRARRNVIGVAETGSGKTLAFGLPILQYLLQRRERQAAGEDETESGCALILAPTRELAMQISAHLKRLAKYTTFHVSIVYGRGDVQIVSVVGGLSQDKQARQLGKCPDVVIATPGRLWEFMSTNADCLKLLTSPAFFVIDEADRMLESGHFRELEQIMAIVRPETPEPVAARTYLFSATLVEDPKIKMRLQVKKGMRPGASLTDLVARLNLEPPTTVHINVTSTKIIALPATLTEEQIECTVKDKDIYLYYLLKCIPLRTLIFVNSIDGIRRLVPLLELLGVKVWPLHADLQQKQRLRNLERFEEEGGVLVASDVASRGLDVLVERVVHYQVARSADVYIHRSGRCARAGRTGVSISLVTPTESKLFTKILMVLKKGTPFLHSRSYNVDGMSECKVDRNVWTQMQKRVAVAGKVNEGEHRREKGKYDKAWMVKTAEEMDVIMSEEDVDEEDVRKGREENGKIRAMKDVLRGLLAEPLIARK